VTNLVQGAIAAFGNPGQKDTYLRRLTGGEWLGAFSLSEPQSGSDAAGLRLAAKPVSGGYRLNGNKVWCSNAGHADLYLVMARTGEHRTKGITSFLVPKDSAGFRIGKLEKKLGLRGSTLAELVFEDCFVAEAQRLGGEGDGFSVALSQLDAGRISIGTVGVGAAIDALERAWRYLKQHPEHFGEGVQQIFAEHFAGILAVKSMIREVSARKDRGQNISALGSAIKLLGSDLAVRVAGDAVGCMGEAGVCREYEVERILRDAKALQIVEGTNQIQRLVLSRELAAMI
jgi:alkylation response protein AidB-like acyl-CoA dehydrogenase